MQDESESSCSARKYGRTQQDKTKPGKALKQTPMLW